MLATPIGVAVDQFSHLFGLGIGLKTQICTENSCLLIPTPHGEGNNLQKYFY